MLFRTVYSAVKIRCKVSHFGDFCFVLFCSPDYNVEFFRQFILVMNALDNRGEIILIHLISKCFPSPITRLFKVFPNELHLEVRFKICQLIVILTRTGFRQEFSYHILLCSTKT